MNRRCPVLRGGRWHADLQRAHPEAHHDATLATPEVGRCMDRTVNARAAGTPQHTTSTLEYPLTMKLSTRPIAVLLAGCLLVSAVQAHEGGGVAGGFISGFMHPLLGWDHVMAMVAVGLWGSFLGAPALWLLPVVFPLVMAAGGALGVLGVAMPGVEIGIALSAVALGGVVATALRPPLWVAAALVGAFAVFHGHAHGTELPLAASPVAYSLGFVISTGLLHLGGIAVGLVARWPAGRAVVRAVGGGIALAGLVFLVRAV